MKDSILSRIRLTTDSSLITNGLVSLICRGLGAILSLGFNWITAYSFGAQGSGVLALGQTLMVVVSTTCLLGLDFTTARMIVAGVDEKRRGLIRDLVVFALTRPVAILTAFSAIIFLVLGRRYAAYVDSRDLSSHIWLFFFGAIGLGQLVMLSQVTRSLGKFTLSQICVGLMGISISLILILVAITSGVAHSIAVPIACYIAGPVLAASLMTAYMLWSLRRYEHTKSTPELLKLTLESLPYAGAQALNFGVDLAIIVVLGRFASVSDVGIFRICFLIATIFFLISSGAEMAAANPFCSAWGARDASRIKQVMRVMRVATLSAAVPLAITIVVFRDFILASAGPEFVSGSSVVVVLVAGQLVNIAMGPLGAMLTASAANHETLLSATICAIVGVISALTLIPSHGIIGAAFASAAAIVARNLASLYFVRQSMRSPHMRPLGNAT